MLRRILRWSQKDPKYIDTAERFQIHREALRSKKIMRGVFRDFHKQILDLDQEYFGATEGLRIELGCGVAPIKENFPFVLATDIIDAPHLDRLLDAQSMDLPDSSVRALYCQNSFHHFPRPELFLQEALRVLRIGGGVILIEPYHGRFASIIYPRLFTTEVFDKRISDWERPNAGPMTDANQALSYIVYIRDKERFRGLFPELDIVHVQPLSNWLRYLLSGGLNFRQLVPDWTARPLQLTERTISPLAGTLALHYVIVLRKVKIR